MKKILTIAAASVIFVMNANASTTPTKTIYEMEKTFEGHSLRMSSEDPATLQSASAKLDSAPASHGSTPVPTPSTASQEQLHPLAKQLNEIMQGMYEEMSLTEFLDLFLYSYVGESENARNLRKESWRFLRNVLTDDNDQMWRLKSEKTEDIMRKLKSFDTTTSLSQYIADLSQYIAEYNVTVWYEENDNLRNSFLDGLRQSSLNSYTLQRFISSLKPEVSEDNPSGCEDSSEPRSERFLDLGQKFGTTLINVISGLSDSSLEAELVETCIDCLMKHYDE